ncbi:hypothetical protein [Gluconobacter sp. GP1]|uniref:hypothetical protein n=1 Tax=Gluconobacter sp. GP1 TaxID=3046423 RepID=UPI00293E0D03|nr:hypothetical protein [Gluconobacter sp. GP1]
MTFGHLTKLQMEVTLGYLRTFDTPQTPTLAAALACFGKAHLYLAMGQKDLALADARQLAQTPMGLDPLVFTAHYALLYENGLAPPEFNDIGTNLITELRQTEQSVRESGRIRLACKLLSRTGHHITVEPIPANMIRLLSQPETILTASENELSDLANHIILEPLSIGVEQGDILALVALSLLRDYKIDTASKICRALLSIGFRNSLLSEAISFVELQRGRDGGYGFFDPFSEAAVNPLALEGGFRLPITVNALWLFTADMLCTRSAC